MICMPARQKSPPAAEPLLKTEESCVRPVILLAEDEAQIRRVFRLVLEHAGYQVLLAADGQEALAVSRAFPGAINLLLTDVEMPKMTGPALWECIRRERPGMKVLLMSGRVAVRGLPFVRKPLTAARLKAVVDELLRTGKPG